MDGTIFGMSVIEAIMTIGAFILAAIALTGGRSAKQVADEMNRVREADEFNREKWAELCNEYTLEENMGKMWIILGLVLAWIFVAVLHMSIFVGLYTVLFFSWIVINTSKAQIKYYRENFGSSGISSDDDVRKGIWYVSHWIFIGLVVFFTYVAMTHLGTPIWIH